ncbi:SigE family RNA polymerase sigma factor [Jatrophihabitans fulvus]
MTTKPAGAVTLAGFARASGPDLLRFAYLLAGDRHRAEDLLQEVLLAMHRRFGDGELPLDNPVGYARRALANQNVSWSRRGASSEVVTDEFAASDTAVAADDPADRDALWHALRRLPVRHRTVLVLRYYADATDDDIARVLDCRRGTVRSLASRGLAALRGDDSPDFTGGAR